MNNITTNINKNTTIYVDMDGTLLDGSHDKWFLSMVSRLGYENAVSVYRKETKKDNLVINQDLLKSLYDAKAKGVTIVLWTNRGEAQRPMTERNLAGHMGLFARSIYGAGKKTEMIDVDNDSIIIDNESRNHIGATNVDVQFGTK